ncbi:MAG: transketolase C-terminal domain-containing protein [bacterium]|nr:transketolase C-terminal domain-containing protein [bacterium]
MAKNKFLLNKIEQDFAPYKKILTTLGKSNPRIVVLGADLGNSTEIDEFKNRFPERFFNIGTAEANEINIAVGLAIEGEIPFVHSFGVFITRRVYEQICIQVAMQNINVKLVGTIPGLTSRLGPTHQAIDDLALMRTLPNMTVIDPADATEISQAIPLIAEHQGPVYIRMMRREVPKIFDSKKYQFQIGKAVQIQEGKDIAIITSGIMLNQALTATLKLEKKGIFPTLLHISTIKPIDKPAILKLAKKVKTIITIENHLITGSLGSTIAEIIAEKGFDITLVRMGLQNEFATPGTPDYLFKKYKLTDDNIVDKVISALKKLNNDKLKIKN